MSENEINEKLAKALDRLCAIDDDIGTGNCFTALDVERIEVIDAIADLRELLINESTDEIVCPYCGRIETDSWEEQPDEEDLGELECQTCFETYIAERYVSVTYSTEMIEK